MEESKKLVRLCHELKFENLYPEVVDRVKYLVLDYLGVAIRGALSESSLPVHQFIREQGEHLHKIPVIGTNLKTSVPFSALANGIAAHSLELDDVVNAASLHPAVSVLSAALPAAFRVGAAGRDLVSAIVAGYEVTVKLGTALDPAAHYARGFHPTGTCGTLGAAISTAKLLDLDAGAMSNALGIAGSQAAGSLEFLSDGSYTKRFHAGWSAHSGVMAAWLAHGGFSGPGTIIEGKYGFLHAYSDKSAPEKVLDGWGAPYEVMRTSIKPHACCRYKQGPIDCILEIMGENGLRPADIEKVELSILKAGAGLVVDPREKKLNPETVVDAQFSMPFGAAMAILYGRASLDDYSLENINDPVVKEMMQRIECIEDPEIETQFPRMWPARARIFTKDGRQLGTRVDSPKGDPENPLTWAEIIAKFKSLTAPVFDGPRAEEIVARVRNLEQEPNLNQLMAIVSK